MGFFFYTKKISARFLVCNKFLTFLNNSIYLGISCLSRSILVYLDLSWFILVYLGSARVILIYLIYHYLSQAISGYLKLSQATMGYLKPSPAFSGYNELSQLWSSLETAGYLWLYMAISGYLYQVSSIRARVISIYNFFGLTDMWLWLWHERVLEELSLLKISVRRCPQKIQIFH